MTGRRPLKTPALVKALFPTEEPIAPALQQQQHEAGFFAAQQEGPEFGGAGAADAGLQED